MEGEGESAPGFFASLGRLLTAVVTIAQNRLELLVVELREERWRFFDALLLAGVVLILALMTLMAATITIVVVCVKADRLDLVIALVLVYLAATILAYWRLRVRLKDWTPFSATLAELKKDKACLDQELAQLALQKRALVAESGLNRLAVQIELQNLRFATAWVSEVARWPRKAGPLVLMLAPLAGFLLTRLSRRSGSWFDRVAAAAKWAGPLYTMWKSFSASRQAAENEEPAASA